MTPIKGGAGGGQSIFKQGGGCGTGTVSGIIPSVGDGEEYCYDFYRGLGGGGSERDDDNITLKNNSEYYRYQIMANRESFISGSNQGWYNDDGGGQNLHGDEQHPSTHGLRSTSISNADQGNDSMRGGKSKPSSVAQSLNRRSASR